MKEYEDNMTALNIDEWIREREAAMERDIAKGPGDEPEQEAVTMEAMGAESPAEVVLADHNIQRAIDDRGNEITGRENILQEMEKPGSRLMLMPENQAWYIGFRNDRGTIKTTQPLRRNADPDFWDTEELVSARGENGEQYKGPDAVKTALKGIKVPWDVYKTLDEDVRAHLPVHDTFRLEVTVKGQEGPVSITKENGVLQNAAFLDALRKDTFTTVEKKSGIQRGYKEFEETYGKNVIAMDDDGKYYSGKENILPLLEKGDKRLFVFATDEAGEKRPDGPGSEASKMKYKGPYAVESKQGKLYVSNAPISPTSVLPETHYFKPRNSLDMDPLFHTDTFRELEDKMAKSEALQKEASHVDKQVEALKYASKYGRLEPPKKPKKPKLSVGQGILWGLTKIFTLGYGDTDANRKVLKELEVYNNTTMKSFQRLQNNYDAQQKYYVENIKGQEVKHIRKLTEHAENIRKMKQSLDKEIKSLQQQTEELGENREARDYQKHTEVRLEGMKDYLDKGYVTRDNLFAYNWMKYGEISGKPVKDEKSKQNLAQYIAGKLIEDKQMKERGEYIATGKAMEQRQVETLNNGSAAREVMNSQGFKDYLEYLGDEPVDKPEDVMRQYKRFLSESMTREKLPVNYLSKTIKTMEDSFGSREMSDQVLDEVIRYDMLNHKLHAAKKEPEPDLRDTERINADYRDMKRYLAAEVMGPLKEADREPYRKAFEEVMKDPANKKKMTLREITVKVDKKKRQMAGPEKTANAKKQVKKGKTM